MVTELAWRTSALTSVLHAAEAVFRNEPIVEPRLAEAIAEPAQQLAAEIRSSGLPAERFWRHLIPLSAMIGGRRMVVEAAVTKTIGRGPRFEAVVAGLDARLAALDAAMRAALPELDEELRLRERPLREQWEARGNGMLQHIGRVTEESLIVPSCDVLLVPPVRGGGGEAHLPYNSVRIEAVLANPYAELPEVVRLAWLIAQVQLDLPVQSETIHADRLPHIAAYAMISPALIAAEEVELMRFVPEAIGGAIAAWGLTVPPGIDAAATVSQWWQTYVETRPPWNVALAALDQMFG